MKVPLASCCPVEDQMPMNALSYIAWHNEAERRSKTGLRQRFCRTCERWRWPDEVAICSEANTISAKEHKAEMRKEND
jgi:hypothetical protein